MKARDSWDQGATRRLDAGPQTPARRLPRPSTNKDSENLRILYRLNTNSSTNDYATGWWVGKKTCQAASEPKWPEKACGRWEMCRRCQTISHRYRTSVATSCSFFNSDCNAGLSKMNASRLIFLGGHGVASRAQHLHHSHHLMCRVFTSRKQHISFDIEIIARVRHVHQHMVVTSSPSTLPRFIFT